MGCPPIIVLDAVTKSLDLFLDKKVESNTILIMEENALAPIASQDDEVKFPRIMNSWPPSHAFYCTTNCIFLKPQILLKTPCCNTHNHILIKVFRIAVGND